jgi:membrane-associated protease RseP (regulator of RpoE activity)
MTAPALVPGAEQPTLSPVRPTRVQILLFAGTILSMLIMYPLFQLLVLVDTSGPLFRRDLLAEPDTYVQAVIFTLTLLLILLVHEMGHFLVARRYRVDVSLPYFLPAPNMLGTFGAVIRMRSPIADRRALLMIGAAGPIAGFLVAVPAVIWGVATSEVCAVADGRGLILGESLLFSWIRQGWHGPLGPGDCLQLSGMADAAWAGLLLTGLNLLPLGQLDGGHIAYALLGRRIRWLTLPLVALLLAMAVIFWPGWAVICVLVLLFGFRHPPVSDMTLPLGRTHLAVALLALFILVLCLTPVPIHGL